MTPTIVFKDGKPVLVTGSPGGSRIITAVLQMIVNVVDYRMAIAAPSQAPRIHHQWLPDEVVGRARLAARDAQGAGGARSQDRAAAAADVGQFDPGDGRGLRRRRRHPHARRAGGGILRRLSGLIFVRMANRSASGAKVDSST